MVVGRAAGRDCFAGAVHQHHLTNWLRSRRRAPPGFTHGRESRHHLTPIPLEAREAALVRRLGWAVILQWEHVPGDLQRRLEEQAALVKDFVDTEEDELDALIASLLKRVG